MLDGAERQARAVIAEWPDGEYEGVAHLDDDGHGFHDIHICARVTKSGSELRIDLSDSHPQVLGFVNSSYPTIGVDTRQSVGDRYALRQPALAQGLPGTPGATRRACLGSWRELSVYELDTLAPGQRIEGPAIVESATTTVLLRAGDTAHATPHGWLDIAIATT